MPNIATGSPALWIENPPPAKRRCNTSPSSAIQRRKGKNLATQRQALILTLKSYRFISDELASRIAPALGIPLKRLMGLLDDMRERRFERDQQIHLFQEHLYSQYYRCICLERRLETVPEGSARYFLLLNRLARARKRYESMKSRYKTVSQSAANWQVAAVLKLPKGTVDSNIYAVKQRFKRLCGTEMD